MCDITSRRYLDGEGQPMVLHEWDGRVFISNKVAQVWNEVSTLASREDDVLICGYPKSGIHWLWEVVTMLTTGRTQLTADSMESQGFLMVSPLTSLDALPGPRVLTTHRRFHDLPTDFVQKRRKMVVILREPKACCVSYYHMLRSLKSPEYEGSFRGFVPLFLAGQVPTGSWFGWVQSFEKGLKEHPELSAHVVHYEQMKANPVEETHRLARYLGSSPELVEDVADQTSFQSMKAFKKTKQSPYAEYYRDNAETTFRKGESEGWRQYFTEEQAADFDSKLQGHLGRSSLKVEL
ncbi:hypothetical protein ACOMHN_006133 [Nucella lapillus]